MSLEVFVWLCWCLTVLGISLCFPCAQAFDPQLGSRWGTLSRPVLVAPRSTATHNFMFILWVRLGYGRQLSAEELRLGWELAGDFSA